MRSISLRNLLRSSLCNDFAASGSPFGSHVDEIVRAVQARVNIAAIYKCWLKWQIDNRCVRRDSEGMKKKRTEEGHSPEEMRVLMHAYIAKSAQRLRKRLREEWKKQIIEPLVIVFS